MRVVIPPGAVEQPTRVNCRYQALTKMAFPPPFMEREALASRVVEISPAGERFRAPVLIEIPHFASTANAERETVRDMCIVLVQTPACQVILRSDDGETWTEHVSDYVNSGEIYQVVEQENVILELVNYLKITKRMANCLEQSLYWLHLKANSLISES